MTHPRELSGHARMRAVLALPLAEREAALAAWTRDVAERVLAEPLHLPPLPHGAREHAQRQRDRLLDPERTLGSYPEQVEVYDRWMRLLHERFVTDGLRLAHDLLLANESELAGRLASRLDTQVRSLDALGLAWWPLYATERDRRPIGFLEFVARGISWVRDVIARGNPHRARWPYAGSWAARLEADDATSRLLGAGFDAVLRDLKPARESWALPVEPGQSAFHGEDPGLDQGQGEIVAPGGDLSESMNLDSQGEDWEVP